MTAAEEEPRRPGAWPAGTRPPGPVASAPPGAWLKALEEYQALPEREKQKLGPCGCDGCRIPTTQQISGDQTA